MHARGPICTWSIAASLVTAWLPTALLPGHYIDTAFGLQLLVHTPCLHGLLAWAGAAFGTSAVMWLLTQHTHATTSHGITITKLQHPLRHLVALITAIVSVASVAEERTVFTGGPLGH